MFPFKTLVTCFQVWALGIVIASGVFFCIASVIVAFSLASGTYQLLDVRSTHYCNVPEHRSHVASAVEGQ